MATGREGFYEDDGHLNKRGVTVTKPLSEPLRKLFLKARTPKEAMELERVIKGDVSIQCSLRILRFQCRRLKSKGKKSGIRR